MGARRAAFWVAQVGATVLSVLVFRIAADHVPSQGLKSLDSYLFGGH